MAARKSLGNSTLTYNSNNITTYLTGTDMSFNGKKIDITDLADTAQNFLTVDGEWKISCEFFWDNALDAILGPDAVTFGTKRTLALATVGSGATITYTWTTNAEVGNYKFGSKTGDVIKGSCEFTCSGAPTRS